MKLAHISLLTGESSVGVEKSLSAKAKECINLGLDIDFYILNPYFEEKKNGLNYIRIKYSKSSLKYIFLFIFLKYWLIEKHIDLRQYDYIILRYQNADISGIKFAKRYKIITEHHTDEVSEIKTGLKYADKFSRKIFLFIRLMQELLFSGKLLRNNNGIIAVTDEIRKIELKKAGRKIPSITITNGIKVEHIKQTGFKIFNGKTLDMVFVSNTDSPWHGLERLINSFNEYKGNVFLRLHIVGNILHIKNTKNDYFEITLHGKMQDRELDDFISNMNLAISSLALYKNNMNEACVLKTREYCARGVPFVLAYKDFDLNNVPVKKRFFTEFPNNNTIIDFNKVITFLRGLNKRMDVSDYMRSYTVKKMDIHSKMNQYYDFIKFLNNINN